MSRKEPVWGVRCPVAGCYNLEALRTPRDLPGAPSGVRSCPRHRQCHLLSLVNGADPARPGSRVWQSKPRPCAGLGISNVEPGSSSPAAELPTPQPRSPASSWGGTPASALACTGVAVLLCHLLVEFGDDWGADPS